MKTRLDKSRNIRKLLKRLSGREKNFRKHQNHVISKKLVEKAKAQNSALAIEDLKNIRQRTEKRLRKSQRAKHSGWSFFQLREFLEYKAKLSGVPVIAVNPRNTSRECSECGYTDKANRKSQSEFVCVQCHHSENADSNASKIIARRAKVTLPQKSKSIDSQKSV